MKRTRRLPLLPLALLFAWGGVAVSEVSSGEGLASLLSPAASTGFPAFETQPTSAQVAASRSGEAADPAVRITIQPGAEDYPGVHLKPNGGPWNLSAYGYLRARFFNAGAHPVNCALRVDGRTREGAWCSNTETAIVKPGEAGLVTVYFGHSYGHKPAAALDPAAVEKLVIFCTKSAAPQDVRVEALEAGGVPGEKPPVKPADVRIKPVDGILLGDGVRLPPAQIEANGGAQAEGVDAGIRLAFPDDQKPKWVSLKPEIGRWDLREAYAVRVAFHNEGTNTVQLRAKLNSNGGATDTASSAPVAPGAVGEVEVAFASSIPWQGIKDSVKTSWEGQKGTGTRFGSDAVSSLTLSVEPGRGTQAVLVTAIRAGRGAPWPLPEGLGRRPPVEGDWVKTFDENFDGDAVDLSLWNVHTENHWDKRSHFSVTNVVVGGGVARLRYEKRTGHHNDDPARHTTDYATGFLDTYGKWVQRYGYFEARMKLPTAPGLWPAFWLMPDRGAAAGPQWVRADTGNGGMEFDIMEHLTRWGLYRFNIALHWDGYGRQHQQTGTQNIYYQPDAEGFITSGLLWLPGLAVFYANGREVARWESPRISNVPSDLMFTHVSGGWDNNRLDDARLPDEFVIDYVRAWQRKDLASAVDGRPANPKAGP